MVYLADSLKHVSDGAAVGDVSFEIAPTVPNLKELVLGKEGGDDSFTYGTGGAENNDFSLRSHVHNSIEY
jgi:hypothetical protein